MCRKDELADVADYLIRLWESGQSVRWGLGRSPAWRTVWGAGLPELQLHRAISITLSRRSLVVAGFKRVVLARGNA